MLWSRFRELRDFHRRYGLARVVVFMFIGHWQHVWEWNSGTFLLSGSSGPLRTLDFISTRRVQLTLALFYVYRAHIITGPDGLSKQVRK